MKVTLVVFETSHGEHDEYRRDKRHQESTLDVDNAVRNLSLVEYVDLPSEAEVEVTLVVD